jgi:MscS family membrane protein
MITIIAFKIQLPANLQFLANAYASFVATALAWLIIGIALYFIIRVVAPLLCHWIPGEIDDILIRIFRKPVLWLTFVFGSLNSINLLNLSAGVSQLIQRIFNTILVLIIAYLIWKLLHDIVFYYGREWVKKTESRIDDTIMPLARLFGSIVLILVAIGVILAIWGVNIMSVLIGAGVLSVVLGFALQDSLRNMFASLSLLIDAPFAIGDSIMLGGDRVFRVEAIGLRATLLYDLFGYSTVYMPNSELTKSVITNISRPTIELKTAITVKVRGDSDLSQVRRTLENIALGFPGVVGNIPEKIVRMTELMHDEVDEETKKKYRKMIEKLRGEHQLNNKCAALAQILIDMANKASQLEEHGYTSSKIEKLQNQYFQPIDKMLGRIVRYAENWTGKPDPYLEGKFPEEVQQDQIRYQFKGKQLRAKWTELKASILKHELGEEMHFDDQARDITSWLRQEYKSFPELWKNPDVEVGRLERDAVLMTLKFVVDDIRLEHNERKNRVITDLAIAIHKKLQKEGIKLA